MAEWASAQRRRGRGHSKETTGGKISEEAELQLVNLLQVRVGSGVVVRPTPRSRLESSEDQTRPRLDLEEN